VPVNGEALDNGGGVAKKLLIMVASAAYLTTSGSGTTFGRVSKTGWMTESGANEQFRPFDSHRLHATSVCLEKGTVRHGSLYFRQYAQVPSARTHGGAGCCVMSMMNVCCWFVKLI
jgi:hypothetical protein